MHPAARALVGQGLAAQSGPDLDRLIQRLRLEAGMFVAALDAPDDSPMPPNQELAELAGVAQVAVLEERREAAALGFLVQVGRRRDRRG